MAEELCKAIEKHRVLYDRSAQEGASKFEVDKAWETAAAEINETVRVTKNRWRALRKTFTRYLENTAKNPKKTRKTRSQDNHLFVHLQFLLPHINSEENDVFGAGDSDTDGAASSNSKRHSNSRDPQKTKAVTDTAMLYPETVLLEQSIDADSGDGINIRGTSTPDSDPSGTGDKHKKIVDSAEAKNGTPSHLDPLQPRSGEERDPKKKSLQSYFIAEAPTGSSMRFRRVVMDVGARRTSPYKTKQLQSVELEQAAASPQPMPVNNLDGRRSKAITKLQRARSLSMSADRSQSRLDFGDSDDEPIRPPPCKKAAIATEADVPKAAVATGQPIEYKINKQSPENINFQAAPDFNLEKATRNSPQSEPLIKVPLSTKEEMDAEDPVAIDAAILAAAAAAEAAAEAEEKRLLFPPSSTETATQCLFTSDEEDEEFLRRQRRWLQIMNPRQKVVFRKGVIQAYLDVYDDPRNFVPYTNDARNNPNLPKTSHDLPSLFIGMSPVEMRLVRHLAIAVAGCKLQTAAARANGECTPPNPPSSQSSALNYHSTGMRTLIGGTSTSPTANRTSNRIQVGTGAAMGSGGLGAGTGLKSTRMLGSSNTSTQSSIEAIRAANANNRNILRTTPIAIPNTNTRQPACMPRLVRKVMRVSNVGAPGSGTSATTTTTTSVVAGTANVSSFLNRHQNGSLVRSRLLSGVNDGSSGSDKQRVYRILANGVIARTQPSDSADDKDSNDSSDAGLNNSTTIGTFYIPNNAANATLAGSQTALISPTTSSPTPSAAAARNSSTPSPTSNVNNRSMLAASSVTPTGSPAANTTMGKVAAAPQPSGMTSATTMPAPGAANTPKITSKMASVSDQQRAINIGRQITADASGRSQMSRRFSICGPAVNCRDMYPHMQRKNDATTTTSAGARRLPPNITGRSPNAPVNNQTPTLLNAGGMHDAPQMPSNLRVRYVGAQNKRANISLPTPMPGDAANQNNINQDPAETSTETMPPPLSIPATEASVPVGISSWISTQQQQHQIQQLQHLHRLQQQQQQQLMQTLPSAKEDIMSNLSSPATLGNDNIITDEPKTNCIITSDEFDGVLIKNEPFEYEDED